MRKRKGPGVLSKEDRSRLKSAWVASNPVTADLEWRVVEDATDYEVSERGHVRRRTPAPFTRPGRIISPRFSMRGRVLYNLVRADKTIANFQAHRLVAEAFIGPRPTLKHGVAHGDDNPSNNHFSNLRWATLKENMADMPRNGKGNRGVRNPMSRVTPDLVRHIRQSKISSREMAAATGLAASTVRMIRQRRTWWHVE